MLPQSKTYLVDGGYSPRQASLLLIGLFLVGVVVIRVVSAIMHHFLPSHVVDCDHTHDDEETGMKHSRDMEEHGHEHDENTPLMSNESSDTPRPQRPSLGGRYENGSLKKAGSRRASGLGRTLSRTYTKYVQGQKDNCDEMGPCKGFSDPCGQDCFRFMQRRTSGPTPHGLFPRQLTWTRMNLAKSVPEEEADPNIGSGANSPHDNDRSRAQSRGKCDQPHMARSQSATHHARHSEHESRTGQSKRSLTSHSHAPSEGQEHHHHVPTNAFMSIGLQTSIAIALHKAPEGFITYATNHANPTLGFAVFMALFIHNITEGFAMSLPLYLALNSRVKAIIWSSFLGGASQPLGAGIAALWFKLAQRSGHGAPDQGIYGGMFAITAGIMTSVALSLFSESLQLSHKKGVCIAFAFCGMGILGLSSALTAK